MKVLIEAISTPPIWRLGGATAKLRIYANMDFQSSDGQWISAGRVGDPNSFFLEVVCAVLGNIITIPSFEIDSTVDALVNPHALYTGILVATNGKRISFPSQSFAVNTLESGDPSHTWGEILLFNNGNWPHSTDVSALRQIASMIQLAVGELNRGSDTNTGGVAVTVPPLDSIFPIAVGANDPLWLALQAGTGIFADSGTAVMVNGSVTVPTALVLAGSLVLPFSMDAGVSHALHIENIVPGVSFDIVSIDGGDNGIVGWALTS